MAILGAWTNGYCLVGATDLSNHVTACTVEVSKDEVDVTAMGATSKVIALGLGDATITVTFLQDFSASQVDAVLSAAALGATTLTVEVRPINSARSVTNPAYTLTAYIPKYSPLSGSVGDAATIDVAFRNASQAGLQRLTS